MSYIQKLWKAGSSSYFQTSSPTLVRSRRVPSILAEILSQRCGLLILGWRFLNAVWILSYSTRRAVFMKPELEFDECLRVQDHD